jgi:hypothetical protein
VRTAYQRFAQQHPNWVACLFDYHFLTHRAAPLLDQFARRDTPPSAFDLAKTWDEQFWPAEMTIRTRRIAELMPAAEDFLTWLAEELAQRTLFATE